MTREKNVFVHLLPYIRRYWLTYLFLSVLLMAGIADGLLFTWFLQRITNAAVAGDGEQVRFFFYLGAALVLLMVAVQYLNVYLESLATNQVKASIADDLFARIVRLPASYYDRHHTGDLVSRITQDVGSISGAIGGSLLNLIRQPLWALAAFLYLAYINWPLALLALLLGPATAMLAKQYGRLLRRNGQRIQSAEGKRIELINDSLSGQLVIRTLGLAAHTSKRFKRQNRDVLELQLKEGKHKAGLQAGTFGISVFAQMIMLCAGSMMIVHNRLTIGELVAFVSLTQGLISPFSNMANTWAGFQRSLAAAERVFQIFEEDFVNRRHADAEHAGEQYADSLRTPNTNDPIHAEDLQAGIRFEHITFSYDGNQAALRNVQLHIPAGQTVAFVGPSGAGKTTLFKLALGLYPPQAGEIRIGEKPISEAADDLHAYMSYVPQDPFLFSGTIRDNISIGKIGASEDEIVAAAKAAHAHPFIAELPQGYDTAVGERGIKLSGGQKQRIAIARAILRNAPILLLDEATSALDSESEAAIQLALKALMKDRTTLVIAHRLSTVMDADLIVVMDQGQIVETGTHRELMEKKGLYFRLFQTQSNAYAGTTNSIHIPQM